MGNRCGEDKEMRMLLTGAIQWTKEQKNEIKNLGHEITFIKDEKISLHEQNIVMEDIEGVVCNGLFLYNDIADFKKLKYIQLTSAGFDRVPMKYVEKHCIEIYNARGVYSVPMAEFVVAGVLQLYKQSRFFYENQKHCKWKKHRDVLELLGKTICVIGCGSVGTECAKRFRAMGCYVIGVDLYPRADENYKEIFGLEQILTILPKSDIVVLTLPLTEETRYLMDTQKFGFMKQGAILVNVSRGAVVDSDALVQALRQEQLGGAVLDVFEKEPLETSSVLWKMENVIITPHNSFVGEGNRIRLQKVIIENLEGKDK